MPNRLFDLITKALSILCSSKLCGQVEAGSHLSLEFETASWNTNKNWLVGTQMLAVGQNLTELCNNGNSRGG